MGRFAEIAQELGAGLGEVLDDGDNAARLAEAERSIALSRYTPAHDPQDRDGAGRIICADCGDCIDPRRLAALPHAIRCFQCQHEEDRREALIQRRFGG